MKKDFAYGIIVFYVEKNEIYFLILQQIQKHWSFPKGHPEKGESKIETARRELYEETGITDVELISDEVIVKDEYIIKPGSPDPVHKIVEFFMGEVNSRDTKIQKGEILDYKWVTPDEAENLLTFESSKRILKSANKIVKNYLTNIIKGNIKRETL